MKRMLLSLPMLSVAMYFLGDGLYTALSNYYPEPLRPFGFLLAAWGTLLGLLLLLVWLRPSPSLLRVIAVALGLPCALILFGHISSGFLSGWEYVRQSLAITVAFCVVLAGAYFCVAQLVYQRSAG